MKRARKERLISTSLIRRLCLSLLLLFGGWASLPMYAQKAVTLNLTNQPFSTFIKQVEQQTDYKFFFEEQSVDVDRLVNVKAQNQDIKVVLDRVLGGTNLTYTIANKKILLKKHESQKPQKGKALPHEISGNVIGEDGSPMIGVSIQVKGKAVGTVTNIDGNYRLVLPNNSDAIVVTYLGYVPQEISLKNNNWQRIVLKEDANMLDAVVVVGYGTVKKRDLTGAISTVKADEMGLTGVSSIGHALEGKAAGLYVRQNSAQPGGGLDILVRGAGSINANNDPLYIVDGFPIAKLDQIASSDRKMDPGTQGVLNFLNPNDVESIEVLKDASATSIYGARAANGVVIITTKRGKEGKAKVSYSYNYSYQKYSDTYDLLSLPEWMEEKNRTTWELWVWNNKVAPWGSKSLEEALASPVNGIKYSRPYTEQEIANAGAGTDWLGLVTRNGHIQEHNINLQGGSQGTQYMLSFNYFNHEGIIRNSGMTRYTMKANIDQEFLNIFKAGLNLTMTRIINDNTQLGSDKWENSGLIRSAVEMGPQIQAYDPATGKYPTNPLVGTRPNPYSLLNNVDRGNTDRLLGNIFIEARPLDGLTLRVNAGIDRAAQSRKTYQPKSTLNGYNLQGVASVYSMDNNQYLLEATATYLKTFAKIHKVNLLAGTSYEQFNYEGVNAGNNNFLTDGFIYNNLGAGAGNKIVGSGSSENKMLSYFFRANYILKDRYLLTATLRSDGASVFAKNHKWGYFPSVALGWTISEENFMKKTTDWLSMLKLRLSWGQTGNADISTNAFASYYAQEAYNKEDKSKQIGVFQGRLENPDLKWETTTEWNVGLDFGFFNNRLSGSVDLYQRLRKDVILEKNLMSYQEVKTIDYNSATVYRARGIDIGIHSVNFDNKNFGWTTDINFSYYRNHTTKRDPDFIPAVYQDYVERWDNIYGYRTNGLIQMDRTYNHLQKSGAGAILYQDLNGYQLDEKGEKMRDSEGRYIRTAGEDGVLDEADMVVLANSTPIPFSINNTFRWKNWDANIYIYGSLNGWKVNDIKLQSIYGIEDITYGVNVLDEVKNRWSPANPMGTLPGVAEASSGVDPKKSDFFLEKAWYLRLDNVSIGYTFPAQWLKNKIRSVRLYAAGRNLAVFTPYKGMDPETGNGIGAYPNQSSFAIGLDVKF